MKKTFLLAVALMGVSTAAMAGGDHDGWMNHKVQHMFSTMDTNKDGSISSQEHELGAKQMFSDVDSSGDRMLSTDELKSYFKNEKGQWEKTRPAKEVIQ